MLFNSIFSNCSEGYPELELKGMRMGYPTNFWADLGEEVCALRDPRTARERERGSENLGCFSRECCLCNQLQRVSSVKLMPR